MLITSKQNIPRLEIQDTMLSLFETGVLMDWVTGMKFNNKLQSIKNQKYGIVVKDDWHYARPVWIANVKKKKRTWEYVIETDIDIDNEGDSDDSCSGPFVMGVNKMLNFESRGKSQPLKTSNVFIECMFSKNWEAGVIIRNPESNRVSYSFENCEFNENTNSMKKMLGLGI